MNKCKEGRKKGEKWIIDLSPFSKIPLAPFKKGGNYCEIPLNPPFSKMDN